jgi:phosphatidate cytidylyltransferase
MPAMHLKRWVTGLTALPLLVWLIVNGGWGFALLVGFACLAALWEYLNIVLAGAFAPAMATLRALALTGAVLILVGAHLDRFHWMFGALVLNLVLAGASSLAFFRQEPRMPSLVARQVLGLVYVPLLLSCLIRLRAGTDGMIWIFTVLVVVFFGDICALYAGTWWGRRKLCPAISPGKTIEGAIAGLTGALMAGSIAKWLLGLPGLAWAPAVGLFMLLTFSAMAGDLFESQLKRAAGVKDSGRLLPGHGGMLDRIDALLFASPVAWVFQYWSAA